MDPITALLSIGNTLIQRIFPDPAQAAQAQLALLKMQQDGDLAAISGQMDINKVEAASTSIFVSGWRPFCGWVCGFGLGYVAIIEPLARFIAKMSGYSGDFPSIDTTLTMQILMGMLGMGGLRTMDKIKGVASK
ncbi:holin [Caudoviricetes sp.]|nr:holin [Caudoviricetes sp.]